MQEVSWKDIRDANLEYCSPQQHYSVHVLSYSANEYLGRKRDAQADALAPSAYELDSHASILRSILVDDYPQ